MKGKQEGMEGKPDPLDDLSQVSEESLERRLVLRAVLGTALLLCLYEFSFFARLSLNRPSGGYTGMAALIGTGIIFLYLALVRIDAGRWGLVHPIIPWGLRKLRKNRPFAALIIVANTTLLLTAIIAILSGFVSTKRGPEAMLILVTVWFVINGTTILYFSQVVPD